MMRSSLLVVLLTSVTVCAWGCSSAERKGDADADKADAGVADAAIPEVPVTLDDARTLCNGGKGFALYLRSDGLHDVSDDLAFFYEDGYPYIYIDQQCHFWTWYTPFSSTTSPPLMAQDIRTGTLGDNDMRQLMQAVHWGLWNQFYGNFYTSNLCCGFPHISVGAGDRNFSYSLAVATHPASSDERGISAVEEGFEATLKHLYEIGEPVPPGPLRVFVTPISDQVITHEHYAFLVRDWPTEQVGFSAYALGTWQNPYCLGQSLLATGDAADAFRKILDDFRSGNWSLHHSSAVAVDEDGEKSMLFIRETLPFENDYGLVNLAPDGTKQAPYCFSHR